MTVTRIGDNDTRTLAHVVRAVHRTTGRPLKVTAEFTAPPPRGWVLRVVPPGTVVVTRHATSPAPAAPLRIRVEVTDAVLRPRLAATAAEVVLNAAEVTQQFPPAPSRVEVTVLKSNGKPKTGQTVLLRPSVGADVATVEGKPGVYTSPPVAWGPAFHPMQISVGGELLRRVSPDVTSRVTRVQLVDPT